MNVVETMKQVAETTYTANISNFYYTASNTLKLK